MTESLVLEHDTLKPQHGMPKPSRNKGTEKPNRTGLQVSGYVDPDIRHALDRYLAETEAAPSITTVLEVALKRYLSTVGYWPPK